MPERSALVWESSQVSGNFLMLPLIRVALLLLVAPALGDDTVADDIGSHMMGRISELLSPEECQAFNTKLLGPEENMREELDRLSEEKNPIGARRRRDILSTQQCKETLDHWLQMEGDTMYWDRLSRALQDIGRPDVSLELGKNLNQDKNLEIKKNVEEYHETVKHLTSTLLLEENEIGMGEKESSGQGRARRGRKASKIRRALRSLDELELLIQRMPLPPYDRSLFEWVRPVATGAIGGFLTSFVLVALAVYSYIWILNEGRSDITLPNRDSIPKVTLDLPSSQPGGIYYTYLQFGEERKYDSKSVAEGGDGSDGGEAEDAEPLLTS
ncbi:transmembrane and death domain protein 1 [Anolis carolinensis]|uniref:transmembrane and death domain protein 1 n=1 Tax=Anolis carolinensis TaxID=28377 RepID=UPI002F2B4925